MIQVEVVSHFNEDPFSYGLVQGLADRIRGMAHEVSCAEHGTDPTVRLSTEGIAQTLNEISVEVSGCCPELVARVRALLEEVRAEAGDVHGD
jgi:hypothetical protein